MAKIRVKAAEGRRVRDPKTGREIPAEGIEVDDTDIFWFRRIDTGDVTIVEEAKAAKPAKETAGSN